MNDLRVLEEWEFLEDSRLGNGGYTLGFADDITTRL